jgi:signal transduction histidine kinase
MNPRPVRFGLRARLALAFALVALAPLAIGLPFVRAELHASSSAAFEAQRNAGRAAVQSALAQAKENVATRVASLAGSSQVETLLDEVQRGALAQVARSAAPLAQGAGLGVLTVLSADGHTLASAQLPARVGDLDPAMLALARADGPVFVRIPVQGERRLETTLALISARRLEPQGLWLLGGLRLDDDFAARLAQASGAQVRLLGGEAERVSGLATPPAEHETLTLGPEVTLELAFSRAAQVARERRLRDGLAAVTAALVGLALLLGAGAARRITRPVEALTEGARRLAAGALDTQVEVKAAAEIGELVAVFNRMGGDLQATTQRLVTAERVAAWQDIARGLAHELKNPLTPIQMSLETLLAAQRSNPAAFARLFPEAAGAMLEEVERLRRTVDAFSRFARLPKPNRTRLELCEWLQGVLAVHGERSGIELDAKCDGPLWVEADRDQLTQVLVNLLQNAADALDGQGRIAVRAEASGSGISLSVEDDGPGIPADQRAKIFEPYFTTKEKGTGLGLAISSRIVAEHGGQIGVEAVEPHGVRFRITLPSA